MDEIIVNGKTYRQVNLHTYSISASKSSSTQSLVDHGANGGIGGSDVCVIYKTHHSVDVQGINNHQMVDIPIATVGVLLIHSMEKSLLSSTSMPTLALVLLSILQPSLNGTKMVLMTNPSRLVASNALQL